MEDTRQKVYLETTVPSYLASRQSRNLIVAAHQQITRTWWETAKERFRIYVSPVVMEEISAGNPKIAAKRTKLVEDLLILDDTADVAYLAHQYRDRLGLQGIACTDIPHFAFAVAYNMEYLVTWNCAHIANGLVIRRLRAINQSLGRDTPLILTPGELLP